MNDSPCGPRQEDARRRRADPGGPGCAHPPGRPAAGYAVARYRPAWWLPGAHAQTIGGRLLRRAPALRLHRERVETPDGDFLDLDFTAPPEPGAERPIVVVLHGLEGCSRSAYVLQTLRELRRRGLLGVAMNFRSCSGEMNRTARLYHAGETGDLGLVLALLRARWPRAPFGAVGFSLGGNVLLKYLGERGDRGGESLDAAVAISVPFDLAAGAEALERGMGRVYTSYFMRRLLRKAAAREEQLARACDAERVRSARTLRDFDDAATAPLHGFRDAAHYYAASSAAAFLDRVRVPTLLLHARDDPFLPPRAIPRGAIARNPALIDGLTARGGHVGFVSGAPWAPVFWAEREAARFLAARLGEASA